MLGERGRSLRTAVSAARCCAEPFRPRASRPCAIGKIQAYLVATSIAGALAVSGGRAVAAPLSFNTALPVAAGQITLRLDSKVLSADAAPMNQDLTAVAALAAVAYGLTRNLALIAMGPLFVDKSLSQDTSTGRITREANGVGDFAFLGRYALVEIDHPGSTFRVAPFAGIQAPTGRDKLSDRFGTLARPLQPGGGAWDPIFGSIATWQTLGWEVDADAGAQINSEADGFRFGDEAFTDQSFQYRLWPRTLGVGTPGFLYGVIESNLQWQGASYASGSRVQQAGLNWYSDVGLEYVTPNYVLEAAVQVPLVTHQFSGTALKENYAFLVGIRWNFFAPYHF